MSAQRIPAAKIVSLGFLLCVVAAFGYGGLELGWELHEQSADAPDLGQRHNANAPAVKQPSSQPARSGSQPR
jgi:hypothetical protein